MPTLPFRPLQPDQDFALLAEWFTLLENELNTQAGLLEYYQERLAQTTAAMALDEHGRPAGFYWATRSAVDPALFTFYLFTPPERRGQGIGGQVYHEMEGVLTSEKTVPNAARLRVNVWDNCPADRAFAERRGFSELSHQTAWELDLNSLDDRPYDALITRFEEDGFLFTDMQALGDTEEAQRNLYQLNETTAMETMGATGEPSWGSFEAFQTHVCHTPWYRPDGQIVAIDRATGTWAAMSAISRFEGIDQPHAYNLFTGVDKRYRGRGLAQAVKVLALRYARSVLQVHRVRTNHNGKNAPMIAIDKKLGYVQVPGTYLMQKLLDRTTL